MRRVELVELIRRNHDQRMSKRAVARRYRFTAGGVPGPALRQPPPGRGPGHPGEAEGGAGPVRGLPLPLLGRRPPSPLSGSM